MTVLLNSPSCKPCAGSTPASSGLAPFYAVDTGILTLSANVIVEVAFVNIRNLTSATQWAMPKAKCLNEFGAEIYPTIVKSATGFTALADEDCTLEYFCIKI